MFRDERSKVNIVSVNEGEESQMTKDEQEVSRSLVVIATLEMLLECFHFQSDMT